MVEPTRRGPGWRWMADATIPSFILQLLISTLGAMLTGVAVVVFLALIVRIASGGYSVDAVQRRIFVLLDEPYFIAPILASFFLGRLGGRFFRSAATVLLWIVPAAVLLLGMASGHEMNVWDNYFGSRCGGSECAYEWLLTAPFYTSVAYTAGWISKYLHLKKLAS